MENQEPEVMQTSKKPYLSSAPQNPERPDDREVVLTTVNGDLVTDVNIIRDEQIGKLRLTATVDGRQLAPRIIKEESMAGLPLHDLFAKVYRDYCKQRVEPSTWEGAHTIPDGRVIDLGSLFMVRPEHSECFRLVCKCGGQPIAINVPPRVCSDFYRHTAPLQDIIDRAFCVPSYKALPLPEGYTAALGTLNKDGKAEVLNILGPGGNVVLDHSLRYESGDSPTVKAIRSAEYRALNCGYITPEQFASTNLSKKVAELAQKQPVELKQPEQKQTASRGKRR